MRRYNPKEIEPKWQKVWEDTKIYQATEYETKPPTSPRLRGTSKRYVLEYFPYPSGSAMHVGHVRNYTIGDAVARYARMSGDNVLHPMGWDAFGLPAENYAIKTGISPQEAVAKNVANFKQQLMQMGFSYDWSREVNSTDPSYYKWTQWFFLLLFRRGLAYQENSLQWWCPVDKTVLANEQVEDGKCWRCGNLVEKKALKQWFLKITDYADRLEKGLEDVNWSESIKAMQRNWIGKSEGAEITFKIQNSKFKIQTFTTRPDTLYGATFMVLAPEHKILNRLSISKEVKDYIEQAERKSEIDRMETEREKTGVFSGFYAINPANNEKIPIWVADYVLPGYGTGAIMAVPAHDERDLKFAKKFMLSIRVVIKAKKDYENVDQKKLKEFTKEIFELSEKNKFTMSLVGGAANSLMDKGQFGLHSDIDIFVDQKGVEVLKKYFSERKLRPAARDGHSGIHSWNNHEWYWGDGIWVDVFLLEEENGVYFDNVGNKKYVWGGLDILSQLKLENVRITIPNKKILEDIEFNLSHSWNYCYTDEGILTHSGEYTGIDSAPAREKIVADLAKKGVAKEKINYKIRDWLISRQRYWGAPIPIIHCKKCGTVPVPEKDLPVVLPEMKNYEPSGDGRGPLANAPEFVNVECPKCGGKAQRETDTMDGFACSSWYFLRFADPHNSKHAFAKEKAEFWLPVDDYIGGAEHAVMHLLYARFWTKVMFDEGLINFDEPFMTLRNQGMILAPDGKKMSKSWNNTIEPDNLIKQGYGADSIRLLELFIGPWNQSANWSVEGLGGTFRFLQRYWTLVQEYQDSPDMRRHNAELETRIMRTVHKTIKKVSEDMHELGFNTAIAALMECVNELYKIKGQHGFAEAHAAWKDALIALTQLLAPFAPHIAEEIWEGLDQSGSVHVSKWPAWNTKLVKEELITIAVQINGKVRDELLLPADVAENDAIEAAKKSDKVAKNLAGKKVKKAIYVPGRLVSLVTD